jgi:hypothetical protein
MFCEDGTSIISNAVSDKKKVGRGLYDGLPKYRDVVEKSGRGVLSKLAPGSLKSRYICRILQA